MDFVKTVLDLTHTGFYWTSKVSSNHWEPTEENWAAWEKGEPV